MELVNVDSWGVFAIISTKTDKENKQIFEQTKEFKIRKIQKLDKPAKGCKTPTQVWQKADSRAAAGRGEGGHGGTKGSKSWIPGRLQPTQ